MIRDVGCRKQVMLVIGEGDFGVAEERKTELLLYMTIEYFFRQCTWRSHLRRSSTRCQTPPSSALTTYTLL